MDTPTEETIDCPLCGIKVKHELLGDETHAWICEECPFVGFEFWNDPNLVDITERLTRTTDDQATYCDDCRTTHRIDDGCDGQPEQEG